MPKVWNIGNTTVRNPKRIETALRVFVQEGFSGNAKGEAIEARLHRKLKENDILEFDGAPSSWNGRKWRAAFYQLGLISYEHYTISGVKITTGDFFSMIELPEITTSYEITPVGKKLINAKTITEIEEIYTRQFACYEIPNSFEKGYPSGSMKPFILMLQVLFLLKLSNNKGLNKTEIGLFLQKFRNHTAELPQVIVAEILDYRRRLTSCISKQELRQFKLQYKNSFKSEIGINPESVIRDYSDTTFRYFSLSGLISLQGKEIVIRENKLTIIQTLLQTEPNFIFLNDQKKYLELYYKNNYLLPTDNLNFALHEINRLKQSIRDSTNPLLREANNLSTSSEISSIQKIRLQLIEYTNWEREKEFARLQQSPETIADIIKYLRVLNGEPVTNGPEIDDRPAFLEWAIWRSFLSINEIMSPIHSTRRFSVDYDFFPRNTAPGGGADLVFEFESYVLAVEVTLTTSHRQMAVESEPVRRHTVQYSEKFPNKDVYCLFIAPTVDNNVAETFRIGVWYKNNDEAIVNIVPMNLSDFINAIEGLLKIKYSNLEFKNLIERCLVSRNSRAPQWKQAISMEVNNWKKRIGAI